MAPLSEEVRTTMDRILDDYLRIQQMLKGDTLEGIQPVVVEIATLTEQVKTLDKEHALHQTIAGITGSAPEMLSGDIQTVREGFKKLSQALTGYVKTADPQGSKNRGLKIFYCPMVKKEWIQKGESPMSLRRTSLYASLLELLAPCICGICSRIEVDY
jgi:hypothetical protein